MGCYGSTDGSNGSGSGRNNRRGAQNGDRPRSNANYLPNPKIEKIIENQFVGEGIKCTPAYECKVSKEELEKWREEFWVTRTQGNKDVWIILKSAVDADSKDAAAIIKASGLNAHAGVMTLVFDEHKFPYRVPIACINEPTRFLPSEIEKLDFGEKPEEEDFTGLKIRMIGADDYEFEASNYSLVSDIKLKFLDATDRSDYDIDHCIFLFAGKKIENERPLYSIYNLKSNMVYFITDTINIDVGKKLLQLIKYSVDHF